jgi:hypothetical protein
MRPEISPPTFGVEIATSMAIVRHIANGQRLKARMWLLHHVQIHLCNQEVLNLNPKVFHALLVIECILLALDFVGWNLV